MKRYPVFFSLILLVIVSGCTTTSTGSEGTVSQGDSIDISGPECHPITDPNRDCSQITEFENIVISAEVKNEGKKEVKIPFRQETSYGSDFRALSVSMIQNTCPSLFSVEDSRVEVRKVTPSGIYEYSYTGTSEVDDGFFDTEDTGGLFGGTVESDEVVLKPGERLEYEWELVLKEDESLLSGFECPLRFKLSTDQSVTTSKRIRFTETGEGTESYPAISSTGPVKLALEAPSQWRTGKEFPVTVYGDNQGQGTISEGLKLIESSPGEESQQVSCKKVSDREDFDHLRMRTDNSGDTIERTFLCRYTGSSSSTSLLTLSADYTYSYNMGEIDIRVCKQGDTC